MSKQIFIDAICQDELRVVSVEENRIVLFEQESVVKKRLKDNLYIGVVTRIELSLQAVFVDYGNIKQGFLSFSDILPHYYCLNPTDKEKALECSTEDLTKRYNIKEVIAVGQELLVQVTKEERGNKGVSFTTHVTISGRYCILTPYVMNRTISRRVNDSTERKRIMSILNTIDTKRGGVIARTLASNQSSKSIVSDYEYVCKIWDEIQQKFAKSEGASLIYECGDLIQKILCDFSDENTTCIMIDGNEYYKEVRERIKSIMPHEKLPVKLYRRKVPIFDYYNIEQQITELYDNRVGLTSGGYIVINQTEALVAIDINSGKMTGEISIEETAYKTNIEAAHEIARQVELRGLSGLIVIDFIDMSKYKNCRLVKSAMEEAFNQFNSYVQIGNISEFGLMEISKQRTRNNIMEFAAVQCSRCLGSGYVKSYESTFLNILKAVYHQASANTNTMELYATEAIVLYIFNERYSRIRSIEEELKIKINIIIDHSNSNDAFRLKKAPKDYHNTAKQNEERRRLGGTVSSWLKGWIERFL